MVHLNRIYTKSGDGGETGLGDGSRVLKTHVRVRAYGGVDELNSVIGVAIANGLPDSIARRLLQVQNDLFDLGADLCIPELNSAPNEPPNKEPPKYPPLRITRSQVVRLENWIDDVNELLEPLNSFILPGGSVAAAHLHLARSVCRRVEIGVLAAAVSESVNPATVMYLNRLSDLLFVMARACNDNGASDILWKPGAGQ